MEQIKKGRAVVEAADGLKVVVMEEGPYLVYGSAPFAQQFIVPDEMGESWQYQSGSSFALTDDGKGRPTMLCRCGSSQSKPYCDGAHVSVSWDSTLTADVDNILDDVVCVGSEELVVSDNEKYCVYARFCHPRGGAWHLAEQAVDPEAKELAIREASMCPSARLMAWEAGADAPYEFDFKPSFGLLEDPAMGCSGGLWVRGGVAVESEDGDRYEVRNRVVLCRCGASSNKPYCDGQHASVGWQDGLMSLEEVEIEGEPVEDELLA